MKYTHKILGIATIVLLLLLNLAALAENAPEPTAAITDIPLAAGTKDPMGRATDRITENPAETPAPKETSAGIIETPATQETTGGNIEFYEDIPRKTEKNDKETATLTEKPAVEENTEEKSAEITEVPEAEFATPTAMDQPAKISEEDLVFVYENTETRLDEDPQALIEEIEKVDGQEVEVNPVKATEYSPEGTSYDGLGMTIRSAKNKEDNEEIKAFFVDTEDWKTARGIHVSDSLFAVLNAYGSPTKIQDDILIYFEENNENKPALLFQMDDNNQYVISIVIVKKLK